MKVAKALFLRWVHLLKHLFTLSLCHRSITAGLPVKVLGIVSLTKYQYIGCSCGRVWLDDGTIKDHIKKYLVKVKVNRKYFRYGTIG